MSQADIDVPDVGWVSDSVAQQIQEQSAKYGVDAGGGGFRCANPIYGTAAKLVAN